MPAATAEVRRRIAIIAITMARTSDIMAVVLQIEFIATAGDIEISRRIALTSVKKARLNPAECNNKINLGAWGLGHAKCIILVYLLHA